MKPTDLPTPEDRDLRRRVARLRGAACLLLAAGLGCGVLTTIPLDGPRPGDPAARFYPASHPPYLTREVVFSHEPHAFTGCETCHPTGSDAQAVQAGGLPSMARCFECHRGEEASQACETCHQLQRRDRKPPSHDAAWQRRHGPAAARETFQCALCHSEPECQECHAVRKPQSHTLRFVSTHGRFAINDRSGCATCHQADFCENCHSQPPPDHTPTFMTSGAHKQVARLRARSCLTCHSFEPDCSPCHGG